MLQKCFELVACVAMIACAQHPALDAQVDTALAMADPPLLGHEADTVRAAQRWLKDARYERDALVAIGRAWMRLARSAHDEGYVLHAAAAAHLALNRAPAYAPALDLLAATRLSAHDFTDAARLAQQVLAREPDDASALAILSDAHLEMHQLREAQAAAETLLALERSLLSLPRAAHLAHLRGDDATAIADYDEALALATPNESELAGWIANERAALVAAR